MNRNTAEQRKRSAQVDDNSDEFSSSSGLRARKVRAKENMLPKQACFFCYIVRSSSLEGFLPGLPCSHVQEAMEKDLDVIKFEEEPFLWLIEQLRTVCHLNENEIDVVVDRRFNVIFVHKECVNSGCTKDKSTDCPNVSKGRAERVLRAFNAQCTNCCKFAAIFKCEFEGCMHSFHYHCGLTSEPSCIFLRKNPYTKVLLCPLHKRFVSFTCGTCGDDHDYTYEEDEDQFNAMKRENPQDNMLMCTSCNRYFHLSCLPNHAKFPYKIDSRTFQCTECSTCNQCRKTFEDGLMFACKCCKRIYHWKCTEALAHMNQYSGSICDACRVKDETNQKYFNSTNVGNGAILPLKRKVTQTILSDAEDSMSSTICFGCGEHGHRNEYTTHWLQCDRCKNVYHRECFSLNDGLTKTRVCRFCRPEYDAPMCASCKSVKTAFDDTIYCINCHDRCTDCSGVMNPSESVYRCKVCKKIGHDQCGRKMDGRHRSALCNSCHKYKLNLSIKLSEESVERGGANAGDGHSYSLGPQQEEKEQPHEKQRGQQQGPAQIQSMQYRGTSQHNSNVSINSTDSEPANSSLPHPKRKRRLLRNHEQDPFLSMETKKLRIDQWFVLAQQPLPIGPVMDCTHSLASSANEHVDDNGSNKKNGIDGYSE